MKDHETLDEETAKKLGKIAQAIMNGLMKVLPKDTEYTDFNLTVNVLCGCMCAVMGSLEPERRPEFIERFKMGLVINMENFAKHGI